MYLSSVTVPLILDKISTAPTDIPYLNKGFLDIYQSANGSQEFAAKCGNGYVSSVGVARTVKLLYKVNFSDELSKNRFELAASAKYSTFVDVTTKLQQFTTNNHTSVRVSINIEVNGSPYLPKLPDCTSDTSLSSLATCSKEIIDSVNDYQNTQNDSFAKILKKFQDGPLSVSKATSAMSGLDYNYELGFTEYSHLNLDNPLTEEFLAKQEKMRAMLNMSTQLAANGSLTKRLKTLINNDNGNAEFNTAANDIISQSSKISVINQKITRPDFIKRMLFNCFQYDESACDKFMDAPGGISDTKSNTKMSINAYIESLTTLVAVPSFMGKGYYSAANPNFANFYWFPIFNQESQETRYYPISLNHNNNNCHKEYANSELGDVISELRLEKLSTQIDGLKYNDWNSNEEIVTKFVPLPADLSITIKSDAAGRITSITRKSNSMNNVMVNGTTYNEELTCVPATHYSYQHNAQIDGVECGEMVDGRHEEIMFSFFNSSSDNDTLTDALLYYGEKPFTSGQVKQKPTGGTNLSARDLLINHIDTHINSNQCNNIGNASLSPFQPWCTSDSGICLVLDQGTSKILKFKIGSSGAPEEIKDLGSAPVTAFPRAAQILSVNNIPGLYYSEEFNYKMMLTESFKSNIVEFFVDGTKTGDMALGGYGPRQTNPDNRYYHDVAPFPLNGISPPKNTTLALNERWCDNSAQACLTLIKLENNSYQFAILNHEKIESSITIPATSKPIAYAEIGAAIGGNASFQIRFKDANHNQVASLERGIFDINMTLGYASGQGIPGSSLVLSKNANQISITLINHNEIFNKYEVLKLAEYNSFLDLISGYTNEKGFSKKLDITQQLFNNKIVLVD